MSLAIKFRCGRNGRRKQVTAMTVKAVRIGVVGGTGYTGVELLRLLVLHPHAEIAVITSRQEAGTAVAANSARRARCDTVSRVH